MTDNIFGLSGKALQLSEDRAVLLTDNIVNSSTPNYKARDIDFYKLMQQSGNQNAVALKTDTQGQLQGPSNNPSNEPIMYRVPYQVSQDGNTVDEELARKNFMENAMHYEVNLTFIQNTSTELSQAIKGE